MGIDLRVEFIEADRAFSFRRATIDRTHCAFEALACEQKAEIVENYPDTLVAMLCRQALVNVC